MLNSKTNLRELAYVVIINDIEPIQGSDNCECAVIGGWRVMVRKNEFKKGDPAIYFEIDSYLDPSNPVFAFMEKKKYKVKTQRYTFGGKGNFISQGLLMSAANFGWSIHRENPCGYGYCKRTDCENCELNKIKISIIDSKNNEHIANDESRFLTAVLGVTYAEASDNCRKAAPADKYKKMAQRYGKLFSHQPFRWLMKREWGKKILFVFFGKKKDRRNWPAWVQRTDEERIQNMPWILKDKNEWIATEKIDGTSTTFTIKKGKGFKKNEFYVCSRNVVFDKPDKKCFYETNVYTEMAEKYHMEEVLTEMLKKNPLADWITIQGETYGGNIQRRDYSMKDHDFAAFNLIMSHTGRWNTLDMARELNAYNIPSVPIVDEHFILPDTIEELLDYATNNSMVDGLPREGIVFRSYDGLKSFKAVSNEFLLAYHQ